MAGSELVAVLRGDLDEIAEHVVVPDLERLHLGVVGVAGLQRGHHPAGFVAQRAPGSRQAPHRIAPRRSRRRASRAATGSPSAAASCAAIAGSGRCNAAIASVISATAGVAVSRSRSSAASGLETIANRGEIARAAARHHQPSQRAGEVGRGGEARADVAAQERVGREQLDRVEPARDHGGVGQRGGKALRQQPRAGDGDGAVDGADQRAAALAGLRAHQLRGWSASRHRSRASRRRPHGSAATAAAAGRSGCARHR